MDLCGPKMKGGIMMQCIYLDNAATSYPKPKEVARAVADYIDNIGCNVNRGGYAAAYSAAQVVLDHFSPRTLSTHITGNTQRRP